MSGTVKPIHRFKFVGCVFDTSYRSSEGNEREQNSMVDHNAVWIWTYYDDGAMFVVLKEGRKIRNNYTSTKTTYMHMYYTVSYSY